MPVVLSRGNTAAVHMLWGRINWQLNPLAKQLAAYSYFLTLQISPGDSS